MTAVMDNLANNFSRTVGQGLITGEVHWIKSCFSSNVLLMGVLQVVSKQILQDGGFAAARTAIDEQGKRPFLLLCKVQDVRLFGRKGQIGGIVVLHGQPVGRLAAQVLWVDTARGARQ